MNPQPQAVSDQAAPQPWGRHPAAGPGLRVTIRGRAMTLRGLRRPPTGVLRWLAILGPGVIAANAGNDAGTIAAYAQAGAQTGYALLWALVPLTVAFMVIQEMAARLGAATGQGLIDLVRQRFGLHWALLATLVVLVANGGVIVSEFAGIAAAADLLGLSRWVAVPLGAALVWYLVVFSTYGWVEKVFLAMTLGFLAYPVAAFLAHPNWPDVARGLVPTVQRDPSFIVLLVGVMGATLTPYQQLFQQNSVVEKGVARRNYGPERADAYAGAILSNLVAAFIVIATAATLHVSGKTDIQTAADAAEALRPVAGAAASLLFAVGLLGASLLAAGVVPLATAYSVSETLGLRKGVNLDFRRAPTFFTVFTVLIVVGAAVALIPNVPLLSLLLGVQVLNGILLPVVLLYLVLLINDEDLVGDLRNTRLYNVLAWASLLMVAAAVLVLLGSQLLGALGIAPGGSG